MDKSAKTQLEDKAAAVVVGATLAVFLGGAYLYTLGKRVGTLSESPNESVHLPADQPETADDPDPAGD